MSSGASGEGIASFPPRPVDIRSIELRGSDPLFRAALETSHTMALALPR